MRLSQRASNGIWMVGFLRDGHRVRLSTGTRDRAEAERKAAALVAAALSGRSESSEAAPEVSSKYTLAQALQRTYVAVWAHGKSAREVRYRIGRIIRDVGDVRLAKVDYAWLRAYGESLRSKGAKPATINRYMSAIGRALTEASRLGWITGKPAVPHYAERNLRERYLSDAEEAALLAAIDARAAPAYPLWTYLRALVPFLLDTGLRLGEALTLTAENLVGHRVVLRHGTTKTDKGRSVPLTRRAQACVKALLEHPQHGRWPRGTISKQFAALCDEIGLPDVSAHTLRHTCASRLVQAGTDLYRVKAWLGHSSIVTTERYAHLRPDTLEDVVGALERGTQEGPGDVRRPGKAQK